MEEGLIMEITHTKKGKAVSILKVYLSRKIDDRNKSILRYSIDIEGFDVFLTDFMKEKVEKLCDIVLSSASEIQIYRHIKERTPIVEFSASQLIKGSYKVTASTEFKDYVKNAKDFNDVLNIISKSIVERIIYLFSAYSLDSY